MPSLTIQIPADLKLEARIRCRLDEKPLSAYACELIIRDLAARGQIASVASGYKSLVAPSRHLDARDASPGESP